MINQITEIKNNNERARIALHDFSIAKNSEEKLQCLEEYENATQDDGPSVEMGTQTYAAMLFMNELSTTKDNELKAPLTHGITSNYCVFYKNKEALVNSDNNLCLSAFNVILTAAKNTTDEKVADDLYRSARFMFLDEDMKCLLPHEAEVVGDAILNNLKPEMENQLNQAHLLNSYNSCIDIINDSRRIFEVPKTMGTRALELLGQYKENAIEDITTDNQENSVLLYWAHHQIRADLSGLVKMAYKIYG